MGGYPEPDNDGYYQQVDDDRYEDYFEEDDNPISQITKQPRLVSRTVPDRYRDCPQNPTSKSGRRAFCHARNAIHEDARKQYNLDVANGTYANLPSSQVFCQCKNCGGGFIAKKADRKRGWGKYCSKSCKAQQH